MYANRTCTLALKPHHAAACFLLRGKNGLSGRLIAAVQARVMVLPPSVQVCVPLSLALRRTKLPLYFASTNGCRFSSCPADRSSGR